MGSVQELHPHLTQDEIDFLLESRCELEGMSAILSSQTYGLVDPECKEDLLRAVMHSANHGLVWHSSVGRDRMGYGAARNCACDDLLESEAGGIMWVDSDIRAPYNAISRLLFTAKVYGLDFLSGVYHHRGGDYLPVFYDWYVPTLQERWFHGKSAGFQQCNGYPLESVAPKAGCGFGFVWTSRRLIEAIKALPGWDEEGGKWFPDKRNLKGGFGEDLAFCKFAMDAGFQLYVDTGVQAGHTGDPEVITIDHFNRRKLELIEEAKEAVE